MLSAGARSVLWCWQEEKVFGSKRTGHYYEFRVDYYWELVLFATHGAVVVAELERERLMRIELQRRHGTLATS